MTKCCFCGVKYGEKEGRTFHYFPFKNPSLLKQWIENIGIEDWTPLKQHRLCSDHFEGKCFSRPGCKVQLAEGSIPTKFDNPMFHCVSCKARVSNKSQYSFHRFPLDKPELLKKWLTNLGLEKLALSSTLRVCSSHFTEDCIYVRKNGRSFLKENSVPTLVGSDARIIPKKDPREKRISNSSDSTAGDSNVPVKSEKELENILPQDHQTEHGAICPVDSTASYSNLPVKTEKELENILPLDDQTEHGNICPVEANSENFDDSMTWKTEADENLSSYAPSRYVYEVIQFDEDDSICNTSYKTPRMLVEHDHRYDSSPKTMRRKLAIREEQLKQRENEVHSLNQKLTRLQKKVTSLEATIKSLKEQGLVSQSDLHCLEEIPAIEVKEEMEESDIDIEVKREIEYSD